ncbi:MAG: methionyl-tRNA formyltransferase [Alphaproteobacteria bacterium]|nr:methionyl-tRNA formyltransferase [Alphaproteobacteria bacterium]
MRLAFLGTPDFAVPALEALLAAGHQILRVYSQPAKPAGRGMAPRMSPVARAAEAHGITIETPRSLKDPAVQQAFRSLGLDAAVVAAYGLILPQSMLDAPRFGCINIHASLLPRWRGAAPIQRALLAGDANTGITIMRMDAGLDTGPMLLAEGFPIAADDTTGTLHDRLAALGAELIVTALAKLHAGELAARPQSAAGVTLAPKIKPEEARLVWTEPARDLARRVRAFAPQPGAFFYLGDHRIKVFATKLAPGEGPPGTVLDEHPTITCGHGALRLLMLQREGKRVLPAAEFLRGMKLPPGAKLS